MAKYKRILLKLSGESLMGEKQYGIDEKGWQIRRANQRNPRTRRADRHRYRWWKYLPWIEWSQ